MAVKREAVYRAMSSFTRGYKSNHEFDQVGVMAISTAESGSHHAAKRSHEMNTLLLTKTRITAAKPKTKEYI